MPGIDLSFASEAVARLGRKPDAVIPILQALQDHYGWLPEEALRRVCESSEITPAAITGVATFYDMFRHKPRGKHLALVCRGTACHVAGAERVLDGFRRTLGVAPGQDTDADGRFTLETVACMGCCTLAPVVKIDGTTLGHTAAEKVPAVVADFLAGQTAAPSAASTEEPPHIPRPGAVEIHVGLGSCCMAKGSDQIFRVLRESAARCGANVAVKRVGCVGMCHRTPMVEVVAPNRPGAFFSDLTPAEAPALVRQLVPMRGIWRRAADSWASAMDRLLLDDFPARQQLTGHSMSRRDPGVRAFLDKQLHIATEHFGSLDPLDLDEYITHEGFSALRRCLPFGEASGPTQLSSEQIVSTIERSGLRGRGGAGFPTGQKWRVVGKQPGEVKHVICNGDEGDPGAFMDRMILESFPFRVIEGLAIAAVAVGASEGVFYIRHEYPLAVKRVRAAVAELERRGWLGAKLLGSDAPLKLSVVEGAGAFVCGEETALIASVEGRRGMPRLRPPFPAEFGLWGRPTLINNVETLALVPWIMRHGAEKFAAIGTAKSKGTKVFALAGNIRRGGLIEVPMGVTIREIIEEIGGGVPEGRRFKAVQIGGPSGGCVPARLAETPVDYESLRSVGAIMGSGGMVVLDDSACMVDIARYFLRFTQDQSCGKCTFCRIGTRRMLDILERLCAGKAQPAQMEELKHLARQVGAGSLCGLGKTAPNPVLSTLAYFPEEYEAHLQGRCPAGKCVALIKYSVTSDCNGCTLCAQRCPVHAIPMTPYARHEINSDLCTRCDTCRKVCPRDAITVT
jgi:NADH-quinone oxidoreductase subunit F